MKFFALTFALSWASWVASFRFQQPALYYLGVFAPAIVALALDGTAPLQRIFRPDVGARWYLFAISYVAAVKLAVAVIHRVALGAWPRFGDEAWYLIAGAIIISTPVQAGEELGWRGYALPRLAARFGMARASLLLGVVWALWHLPFFFLPGTDKTGQSITVYTLQVTALSVAMAWLYVQAKGSLLLMMLMHSAGNQTKDIVPSVGQPVVAWLTVGLLWVCAVWFMARLPAWRPSPAALAGDSSPAVPSR